MKTLLSKEQIKKNILLMAIWGAVIVTGFLALGAIVGGIEGLVAFGRIHSFTVRLGLVYTVVHIFRHREQIMAHFGVKFDKSKQSAQMGIVGQSLKCNRVVNVVTAVVFHIVLHIISIHLAVAYTIYHIVQHRHEISTIFKKLSFKSNTQNSHAMQAVQLAA